MSPWAKLAIAILLEVGATISLRQSDNFSNLWWSAAMVTGYLGSFWFLAQITDQLEIGTIYAIWSGAGTAVIAALGVALFDEKVSVLRVCGVLLIVLGVIALNLGGSGEGSHSKAADGPSGAHAETGAVVDAPRDA